MNAFDWIDAELAKLEHASLRRRLSAVEASDGVTVRRDGRRMIQFASNDYLGLAGDPRLVAAAHDAAARYGVGSRASPLVCGRTEVHEKLEQRLAEFEHTEAALLVPTGFAANTGCIPALVGEGDAIYADAQNHASLIDGCRLSKATRHVYPHADCKALSRLLAESNRFRRRLIVTDSVFSMDGDIAPLETLFDLANEKNAMLLVDEAHATGVLGTHGRGAIEHVGLHAASDDIALVCIGTLSKAIGCAGGFVAGPQKLIDWLANAARPYMFSTAMTTPIAAAALAALDIVQQEPSRREQLLARAARLRNALSGDGWNIGQSTTQIIPIIIGDAEKTMKLSAKLAEAGMLVPGIRPPTVPENTSRLRISVCWQHTDEMTGQLPETLRQLR